MSDIVFYRKYRPDDFEEVVGQEHVTRTLRNAIARRSVAHAYLFAGPKGTGKTTLARILAKAVNCEKAAAHKGNPCRECPACKDIADGRVLDIIEMDAASNRGIDEIRELREGARAHPTRLKYKVYIIDEAHQLTKEAFNALLKTLEEPPEHVIFIFATTAADKMPATILSRVQRFDFKKFTLAQITDKLTKIMKEEKAQAEPAALGMIASAAEGGLRDAESMLSQVCAHAAGKVTAEAVEEILGIIGFSRVAAFASILEKKDLRGAIVFLRALEEKGVGADEFLKSLVNHLRKVLLLCVDVSLRSVIAPELTDEQFSTIMAQISRVEKNEFSRMLFAFMEAQDAMRKTPIPFLPIELALFQLYAE